jgi:hypothetical protein
MPPKQSKNNSQIKTPNDNNQQLYDLFQKNLVSTMSDSNHHDSNNEPQLGEACCTCFKPKPVDKNLLVCGSCKITTYCDKECQKNHWKNGHKVCFYTSILLFLCTKRRHFLKKGNLFFPLIIERM